MQRMPECMQSTVAGQRSCGSASGAASLPGACEVTEVAPAGPDDPRHNGHEWIVKEQTVSLAIVYISSVPCQVESSAAVPIRAEVQAA